MSEASLSPVKATSAENGKKKFGGEGGQGESQTEDPAPASST